MIQNQDHFQKSIASTTLPCPKSFENRIVLPLPVTGKGLHRFRSDLQKTCKCKIVLYTVEGQPVLAICEQ